MPACWGLRPPRDSTPCPRHWFGLFGLRHQVGLSPAGGAGVGGAPVRRAWCSALRKPLFLRREAPRLWGRMGLRQVGRGALLPANPCSFVVGHHVSRVGWASGKLDVVLRSPLTLVPSLRGTTSLGPDGSPASWTWCSAPR